MHDLRQNISSKDSFNAQLSERQKYKEWLIRSKKLKKKIEISRNREIRKHTTIQGGHDKGQTGD